jgi:hypothetical protein
VACALHQCVSFSRVVRGLVRCWRAVIRWRHRFARAQPFAVDARHWWHGVFVVRDGQRERGCARAPGHELRLGVMVDRTAWACSAWGLIGASSRDASAARRRRDDKHIATLRLLSAQSSRLALPCLNLTKHCA